MVIQDRVLLCAACCVRGDDDPEPGGVGVKMEAAVDAKILPGISYFHSISTEQGERMDTYWSQKGTASSLSLPIPANVRFWTTARGLVA